MFILELDILLFCRQHLVDFAGNTCSRDKPSLAGNGHGAFLYG